MSKTAKEFPTLYVATALTGIGLVKGVKFSDVQQVYDQVLGRPVWTHELAHAPTVKRVREIGYGLFPDMPSKADAESDYAAAAAKATAAYGETVTVPLGSDERTADPVSTFSEMRRAGASQ